MENLGRTGELLARRYLEERGLTFRQANLRSPFGEIDLVMEDSRSRELVFVEVRTRSGMRFGTPEESVTAAKRKKLRALVTWYCQHFSWNRSVRLDVVGVVIQRGVVPTITHTMYVG